MTEKNWLSQPGLLARASRQGWLQRFFSMISPF